MWPLPMMYLTSLYRGHPVPRPPSNHDTLLYRDTCSFLLLMASGGHQWRPVQTCSLQPLPQLVLTCGGYWSMYSHVSGRYASYKNAFLLPIYYRPQWSCSKVIFSEACVKKSVHRGRGCLPQCMLGYTHPPGQTPSAPSRRLLLWTVRILLECIMVASKIEEILLQWCKRLIPFKQKMLVKLNEFDKYNNQV